jgi:multidrug resistance efflux pump
MMAAIFGSYAALIWLVFAKLRIIPLTLPIAIVLAAVGPLFAFYIILSMNNYHPSSTDARVFQRVVQITPHITVPGRVQSLIVQSNTPLKKGDVLFTIDPRPFQFEVNRLEAAVAAADQLVPQLKAALDQASAGVERAEAQLNLAQADVNRQTELFTKR